MGTLPDVLLKPHAKQQYVLLTNSNFAGLNNFPDTITAITSILPSLGFSSHTPPLPKPQLWLFLVIIYVLSCIHHLPTASTCVYTQLVCWSVEERNFFQYHKKIDLAGKLQIYIIFSDMHLYINANGRNIRKIFRVHYSPLRRWLSKRKQSQMASHPKNGS